MQTVGAIIGSLGLGLLSSLGGKKGKAPTALSFEDQPTTLATRGAYVPLVVGRRRVAPVVSWAGDRIAGAQQSGKKGLGRTVTGFNYFEAAMHAMCLGVVHTLHSVEVDNTAIYSGPLESSLAESGVMISASGAHSGSGYVYFGEKCQPINERLAQGSGSGTEGIGVASRWPHIAYIEWRRLFLGSTPVWPEVLYDVEVRHDAPIEASPSWIDETSPGARDGGVNPAHALWSVMFRPFPHGAGLDPSIAMCDCFNALAELFATERLPVNFAATNGLEAARACAFLMQETQTLLPDIAGMIAPRGLREAVGAQLDALPVVNEDAWGPRWPEEVESHAPFDLTRVAFAFDDASNNYRAEPVPRHADAAVEVAGGIDERVVRIETATDRGTAAKMADRLAPLELAPLTQIRFEGRRGATLLLPGDQFKLDIPGEDQRVCAVNSIARQPARTGARIEAVAMRYASSPSANQPASPPGAPAPGALAPDSLFTVVELPFEVLMSGIPRIGVLRIRNGEAAIGAHVLASLGGASFQQIGDNNGYAFGGTLQAALIAGETIMGLDGDGPVIDQFNDDVAEAVDLSDPSLENDWLSGRQAAQIGEGPDAEIVFVRALTSIGGGAHRLESVVRARFDTIQKDHAAGTPVYFFTPLDGTRISSLGPASGFALGQDIDVKTQPFNQSGVVDPGLVAAESVTIEGRAARPLPCDNLRANNQQDGFATYASGQNIIFSWTYRVREGAGSAAGEQLAGWAIGAKPTREGPFEVQIWSGSPLSLKRVLTVDSDDTLAGVAYTDVMNVADHGAPAASVTARIAMRRGSLLGALQEITIDLE